MRAGAAALLAMLAAAAPAAAADRVPVVLVANAEGGTVSIVDTRSLKVVREIDVLPDGPRADADPVHGAFGQALVEAAGGTNFAQDQDVSPDGRTLYVSRGHRGDVAAFAIRTGRLKWKVDIGGLRADHMTIAPDGSRLYVSALTEQRVEVVDTREHAVVATSRPVSGRTTTTSPTTGARCSTRASATSCCRRRRAACAPTRSS